jgi:hypothetical protein
LTSYRNVEWCNSNLSVRSKGRIVTRTKILNQASFFGPAYAKGRGSGVQLSDFILIQLIRILYVYASCRRIGKWALFLIGYETMILESHDVVSKVALPEWYRCLRTRQMPMVLCDLPSPTRTMWKPFKPPLLKGRPEPIVIDDDVEPIAETPPPKRRRIIHIDDNDPPPFRTTVQAPGSTHAPRKPLLTVRNPVATANATASLEEVAEGYYLVLW